MSKAILHFERNGAGKDYVVGDIHGCFRKLELALVMCDFDETKDRLFSVGDLVDRGPESEESIDWIAKPWFHAVRGNHEQMAIDYASGFGDCYYSHNGGQWFMNLSKSRQQLFADVFKNLPLAIDVKGNDGKLFGIVHADPVHDDWNVLVSRLEDSDEHDALGEAIMWDRSRFNSKDETPVSHVTKVFVGHTPTKTQIDLGNISYIDQGAVFKNGALTIIELT